MVPPPIRVSPSWFIMLLAPSSSKYSILIGRRQSCWYVRISLSLLGKSPIRLSLKYASLVAMEMTGNVSLRGKKIYDCVVDGWDSQLSQNSFARITVVDEMRMGEVYLRSFIVGYFPFVV